MSGLPVRGINYDVGTAYVPGTLSRPEWDAVHAGEDLRAIAAKLHCTAVCVFGTDISRLSEAAELALERGLENRPHRPLCLGAQGHLPPAGRDLPAPRLSGEAPSRHLGRKIT
ncbi:hypothetical protein ACFWYW_50110 [Nonomuraea sp. NPDC059023]|uniref:hypothetical protein n=1 Tax=unclassified Nonomuraea TaxID=2593643 RepID=UPI00369C94D1